MRKIIAIDPPVANLGYAIGIYDDATITISELGVYVVCGDRKSAWSACDDIFRWTKNIVETNSIDSMVIELPPTGGIHNLVAKLSRACAAMVIAAEELGIEYELIPTTTIKKIVCGDGRAKKGKLADAVIELFGIEPKISRTKKFWMTNLQHTLDALGIMYAAVARDAENIEITPYGELSDEKF